MRKINFEDRKFQLSERDYKQLRRRFDASLAKLNSFNYYCIPVKPICWNRKSKCLKCPLRSPQKRNISCNHLFTRVMGENLSGYLYMVDSGICWKAEESEKAHQALGKINILLKQAEKVMR